MVTACYGLDGPSPLSYFEVQPPVPENVTIFIDKVFREVIKVEMNFLGHALSQ